MSELQSLLEQLGDDGEARGATAVFVVATRRASVRRRVRRRRRVLSSCAAVLAVVVGVVAIVHATATSNSAPDVRTRPGPSVTPTSSGATAPQLAAGHWDTIPAAPVHLTNTVTAWTGSELFVWGQLQLPEISLSSFRSGGALYNPATRTWRALPSADGVIEAAEGDVAVWTGREVVIWSRSPGEKTSAIAAAYNPTTNRWRKLPPAPVLEGGPYFGIWTGDRAVFFASVAALAYDPVADRWTRLPVPTAPARSSLLFATGAGPGRILAWSAPLPAGGVAPLPGQTDGTTQLFRYDEATNRWTTLGTRLGSISLPQEAIWTGTRLLVRGDMTQPFTPGPALPEVSAWYDPDTGVATRVPADSLTASGVPAGNFSSVWTDQALLSMNNGQTGELQPGDASAYDPTSGAWLRLQRAPFGCPGASLVWTGTVVATYCAGLSSAQPASASGLVFVPGPAIRPSTISGTLHSVGGPAPGLGIPLPGRVIATDSNGATFEAVAGSDGKFSLSVPEGSYTVTGRSPQYESGTVDCQGGVFLVRPASETTGVVVACQER